MILIQVMEKIINKKKKKNFNQENNKNIKVFKLFSELIFQALLFAGIHHHTFSWFLLLFLFNFSSVVIFHAELGVASGTV